MATTKAAAALTPPTKKTTNTTKGNKKKTSPKKMPSTNGIRAKCQRGCSDSLSCFHGPCAVARVLGNGRLVLENGSGYVRLADIDEVEVRVISADKDLPMEAY